MTDVRSDIAAHIRKVDDGYELSPYQLAQQIGWFLQEDRGLVTAMQVFKIEDFAYEQNRGAGYRHPKPMTAEALADAIVDRFNLKAGN